MKARLISTRVACRKRRIKCGEERPTCHNCTKSKRLCEGYNQRVVFKNPLNSYRPPVSAAAAAVAGRSRQSAIRRNVQPQELTIIQTPLNLAPRPSSGNVSKSPLKLVDTASQSKLASRASPHGDEDKRSSQDSATKDNFTTDRQPFQSFDLKSDTVDRSHIPDPEHGSFQRNPAGLRQSISPVKQEPSEELARDIVQSSPRDHLAGSGITSFAAQELYQDSNTQFPASSSSNFYHAYESTEWVPPHRSGSASSSDPSPGQARVFSDQQPDDVGRSMSSENQMLAGAVWSMRDKQRDSTTYSNFNPTDTTGPHTSTPVYSQVAYDYMDEDDDDPWDVSDDDTPISGYDGYAGPEGYQDSHLRDNDLGIQVVEALESGRSFQDAHPRSIIDFIDRPNILATYVPSPQSTPLSDPVTARIFCHFVNVTAPCMSMFERHPANPSLIFQGRPIPASQQHIWTCKLYLFLSKFQQMSPINAIC
jgi:hypothetical protein